MSRAVTQPFDCNNVCVPGGASSTPGPEGPPGAPGTNGTNGVSAYTTHADGLGTMPDGTLPGSTVTLNTASNTGFLVPNMLVYVEFWGYLVVEAVPTATSVTLSNPEDGTGVYADNAAPGTTLPAGAKITVGGWQGPAGDTPADALLAANNLNDVDSVSTARTNLGLGTAAQLDSGVTNGDLPPIDTTFASGDPVFATGTGLQTQTAATARTTLGLGTMATQNAGAVAISGGTVTGITDLAVADGGTGASTPAAARTNLGVLAGYGLLASATGVDLNTAGDTTLTMAGGRYIIDKMTVENASISLTTATAGVFTAAGGGGTTLAADQALSALTAAAKFLDLTPQGVVGTDTRTEGTLYFRVGTPQGAAATGNVFIYGWKLT